MSVISLAERKLDPVPDVVALLESMLDKARRGEIRGVAVAVSCDAKYTGSAYDLGDGTISDLYLAMGRMQRRLLDIE